MNKLHRALTVVGVSALALLTSVAPASAQVIIPTGSAFADSQGVIVDLTLLTAVGLPGPFGDTQLDPNTFANASQSCPPTEEAQAEDRLLDADASPAARADTVTTTARATCPPTFPVNPEGTASAQTEGFTALISGGAPMITADVIRAQANASCTEAPNAAGSVFTNLKIAGQAVPLGPLGVPEPNTRIEIPGIATVIVNEQHAAAEGRGIVVNGLHVIGASPVLRGDMIVSHASAGVFCPGVDNPPVDPDAEKPDVTFTKTVNPESVKFGSTETVTYTSKVTNQGAEDCDVVSYIDHLTPAVEFVSTSGAFGDTPSTVPPAKRADQGEDVVLKPTDLVIAAGQSVEQVFVAKVREGTKPGTYSNNLEIFCAVNGNFVSGPIAPLQVLPPPVPNPCAEPGSCSPPTPDPCEAFDSCPKPPVPAPECSDERDNDGDGKVDFPDDPGCDSSTDDRERDTECSDGRDNDADAKVDFPADPGCDSSTDDRERDRHPDTGGKESMALMGAGLIFLAGLTRRYMLS